MSQSGIEPLIQKIICPTSQVTLPNERTSKLAHNNSVTGLETTKVFTDSGAI